MILSHEYKDAFFELYYTTRPCQGELQCGDMAVFLRTDDAIWVGLIDGLGHGNKAAQAAQELKSFLEQKAPEMPVNTLLQAAHNAFLGTQGACASLVRISNNGEASFAGVGNVATKVITNQSVSPFLIAKDGALGVRSRSFDKTDWQMQPHDILFFYSDGISENLIRTGFPVQTAGSKLGIEKIIETFGKSYDDVSFLWLRKLS